MTMKDKIVRILRSQVHAHSGAYDVEPSVTNADTVADSILGVLDAEPLVAQSRLRSIGEFCLPGTQIRSPGGLCIDPLKICAVESYGGRDGYIVVHLPNSSVKITFFDNVSGGPPDVYAVAAALQGRLP